MQYEVGSLVSMSSDLFIITSKKKEKLGDHIYEVMCTRTNKTVTILLSQLSLYFTVVE
jgi:hypothetical protein